MSKVLHATCYKVAFPGEFNTFGVAAGAPKVLHATKMGYTAAWYSVS
jgi:hypothetical protein